MFWCNPSQATNRERNYSTLLYRDIIEAIVIQAEINLERPDGNSTGL